MRVWLDLKYVLRRPSGLYYYRRRIPDDLQGHHNGLSFFVQSLKTHEAAKAEVAAVRVTKQLDTLWSYFRNPDDRSIPATLRDRATAFLESHGFKPGEAKKPIGKIDNETPFTAIDLMLELYEDKLDEVRHGLKEETEETAMILEAVTQLNHGKVWHWDDALALHHQMNGAGKSKADLNHIERPIRRLLAVLGDKPLSDYTREDANALRNWLYDATDQSLKKSPLSTSSVKRSMDSVNSVFNLANQEQALKLDNPFSGLRYRKQEPKERPAIPVADIAHIQRLCLKLDDDMRWLIALISDTGLRLGEAAGLERRHVDLDPNLPHLIIEETDNRRLKTKTSRRRVPLVGMALWAARKAVEASLHNNISFLFPRYNRQASTNSNSASNGLNKWMKEHIPPQYVLHGFRHAMRDRLREVDCPQDVMDEIGGWSKSSVGQTYGQGSSLERLHRFMERVVI
jgi:integrase